METNDDESMEITEGGRVKSPCGDITMVKNGLLTKAASHICTCT